ncbi:cytochrome c551 [Oceanobacillus senegalensis]|uniref:cytochrome c551 n=1 Tax=Oceanobacillus senegalensis TaxID=1936063 RepID=UPI000A30974B|nr:cytochrome c [Oceanobacillus senegalensis]
MKKWLVAVLFGFVLTLAACGGGDDGGTEEPADNGDDAATEEPADNGNDTATEEPADEGGTAEEGGTVDAAAAEDVYANNCAMCHGADLTGGGGPDLTAVGSKYSADEIAEIIQNGTGSMPAQSQVTGEDLDNLSNWLAEKQ